MSRLDLSPRYFTPAIKPRFKPRVGGRITPFGISKPQIKPRILPTPVKAVTSGVGGGGSIAAPHIAAPHIASLKTATSSGKATTGSRPAAPPKTTTTTSSTRVSSNPRPAGYKPPRSAVARRPGMGPTIPRRLRTKII